MYHMVIIQIHRVTDLYDMFVAWRYEIPGKVFPHSAPDTVKKCNEGKSALG